MERDEGGEDPEDSEGRAARGGEKGCTSVHSSISDTVANVGWMESAVSWMRCFETSVDLTNAAEGGGMLMLDGGLWLVESSRCGEWQCRR